MQTLNDEISDMYGGSVRLRVCGICIANDKILLVNHSLYGKNHFFWSPPGGGVRFGETAIEALEREFMEETGLDIEVGRLLFIHEHIQAPLHAVEMFFLITSFKGTLKRGEDPEISKEGQIIEDVRFMSWEEINESSSEQFHRMFSLTGSLEGIFKLENYISGAKAGSDK